MPQNMQTMRNEMVMPSTVTFFNAGWPSIVLQIQGSQILNPYPTSVDRKIVLSIYYFIVSLSVLWMLY